MRVTYKPEGSDEAKVWDFRAGRIRLSRGAMIEQRYAKLIGEKSTAIEAWRMGVLQQQATARRVLLWHLLDLEHPGKVRIDDVDPFSDELEVEASKQELVELKAALENVGGLDEMQREMMLAQVDAQIAAAPDDDDAGKAPSPTSDEGTGGPSPK